MDDVVARKNASAEGGTPQHFFGRVLRPGELLDHASYSTPRMVSERLRPFVKRYWAVTWDLPDGESYQTSTVSEPTINLTFEFGSSRRVSTDGPGVWVTGPVTERRFDVGIFGRGGVLGVNFHLGATLAFSDRAPSIIRNSTVAAAEWFPTLEADLGLAEAFSPVPIAASGLHRTEAAAAGEPQVDPDTVVPDIEALAESVENWLLSRRPEMTQGYSRLKHVLDVLADPEVVSLQILSRRTGIGERTLQRMFDRYCGVGVKKILARARIIDAVGAIDRGWNGSLADLGIHFGWYDQSHFSADFLRVTGFSPRVYSQRASARVNRG
ncbi:helix-turn-helix domain-containing protein [Brevibacterium renqingii]|uniref:helix-turn-helix domain-containing protein n=1 Tax=Brevibacterium renqingii TaxID=2776916 RepID=UPI001AE07A15|nr:helix-turn-helix domain-containing protein [Brevibacterium renqingii]